MKAFKYVFALILVLGLAVPAAGRQEGVIPDTGELYGDLYVILRDVDGVPILHDYTMVDEDGNYYLVSCVQPISSVNASVTIPTDGGDWLFEVFEGEPFALPTYIDTVDGDAVECELTEEMADWVQTVDFGRLNLGRAPDSVIFHAFDEAINKLNAAQEIAIDPAGRLVMDPGLDSEKTIDSPAENLALYIKMMTEGHWITTDTAAIVKDKRPDDVGPPPGDGPSTEPRPVLSPQAIANLPSEYQGLGVVDEGPLTSDELQLAASLLAAAADKTGSFSLDKVMYINSIYGINVVEQGADTAYFDFGAFGYDRGDTFEPRYSGEDCESGKIWVIQPEEGVPDHYVADCIEILGYNPDSEDNVPNAVHFTDMVETYTTAPTFPFDANVRGFTQAADDALQVLEYIHNYKVPVELYP